MNMFCDDPIKNNLTWLSEDTVDDYFNKQADLSDSYPHAKPQANLVGNLFLTLSFFCIIYVVFTFISKVGIV
jgi:hypothetical protein